MSHSSPVSFSHPIVVAAAGLWPFDPNGTRIPALFTSHGIVDRLLPPTHDDALRTRLRLLRHPGFAGRPNPERTDQVTKALICALACPSTRDTFTWSEEFGDGLNGLAQWLFNVAHRGNPLLAGRRGVRPVDWRQSQLPTREAQLAHIREVGRQTEGALVLRECLRLLARVIGERGGTEALQTVATHAEHWLPFLMEGSGTHSIALSAYLDLAASKDAQIGRLNAVCLALRHPDPPCKSSGESRRALGTEPLSDM